jgi:phage terminase large subunit
VAAVQERVVIPYAPRPLQRVLHDALDAHRWAVAVCHRRFGKTVLAINHLQKQALLCTKPRPRFAYIAPTYRMAKAIAWDYLKHFSAPIPGRQPHETELRIDYPNEGQVRLYGADNPDALRGIYLDGVVLDEYGLMDESVWGEVIRPLLSDREGWAFFIGTPNGRNQFYELIHGSRDGEWRGAKNSPDWFCAEYKASITKVIPEHELADARKAMTDDQYQQEYECSFEASVKGAIYARELAACREDGRMTRVPYDPRLPVDTAWDLGMDDATAIWFSQTSPAGEIRLLGYYENTGLGLQHYVGLLAEEKAKRGWAYGEHYLPHDVEVKELGTGVSRLETLRSLGLHSAVVVPRTVSLADDINAVRMMLPRCYFNVPACDKGVESLQHYRRKDETTDQTGYSRPVHDWACVTGDTKVLTRYGMHQIQYLPDEGEVLTPCGWKRYENPRITRRSAPLVAVTFDDGLTVRCTPEHRFLTDSGWRFASDLRPGSLIQSSLTHSFSTSTADSIGSGRKSGITREAESASIATCGRLRSGLSRQGITSTIATAIHHITRSRTWNCCQPLSIWLIAGRSALTSTASISAPRLALALPSGTPLRLAAHGIDGTPSAVRAGRSGNASLSPASTAERSFRRWFARVIHRSSAPIPAKHLRIASVEPLAEKSDVWCLTVPDGHMWSLENGAVTHNSHGADALRTLACAPQRKAKLIGQWNLSQRDHDPDDQRYGKGRFKQASAGRRGGW